MNSKPTGFPSEKIALNYLKRKGYQILDKNYLSKFIPCPWQVDAISLKINLDSNQAKIRHFQNAVF